MKAVAGRSTVLLPVEVALGTSLFLLRGIERQQTEPQASSNFAVLTFFTPILLSLLSSDPSLSRLMAGVAAGASQGSPVSTLCGHPLALHQWPWALGCL
ncbi:hypothetical protein NDU88_004491 [Pleurodeles waltl]|uniref:Uncharacterized protein n=1 Tax=Pleurodeles waltl TaxID=8319 RepID=A0AAV7T837_PLEWA|nr:hypothetical protein NDU88_004491 [Pleurodeles waltl]